MKNNILAVVTARKNSKRIPGKNLKNLDGRPLITYTFEALRACREVFCGVIVTTDDPCVIRLAKEYQLDAPFLRPEHLSSDTAKSVDVLLHAVSWFEQQNKKTIDWVMLLQPTSPLRTSQDILGAIGLIDTAPACDSIVSVCESPVQPIFLKKINEQGFIQPYAENEPEGLRRQDIGELSYIRNGAIYLTRRDILMLDKSIYGSRILPFLMNMSRSIDIDTELDFTVAETIIRRGLQE